ncbi:hypothetical protein CPB85DRAFT_470369 [Mucidula mucida]|nr:hypothetical protein CPB85DRAFT_470369 [Mucidula mucida]
MRTSTWIVPTSHLSSAFATTIYQLPQPLPKCVIMDLLPAQTYSTEYYQRPSQGPNTLIENMVCDDVLNEIFNRLVCVDTWSPHRFSQVCSRWRVIALNNSTLWNHIYINENAIDDRLSAGDVIKRVVSVDDVLKGKARKRVFGNAFPIIKRMLERSRTQPLDIFIDLKVSDPRVPWEVYQTKSLAALLAPYVTAFRTFYIGTAGLWKHCAILLEVLRGRLLPNLEDLKIDRSYQSWQSFEPNFDASTYIAQTAPVPSSKLSFYPATPEELLCPKLWRLSLTGTYHDWDRFVARNLVCLTVSKLPLRARPTAAQFRTMLKMSSTTLEVLDVTGALPFLEPEDGNITPPLTLTRLTHLRMGYTMPLELDVFACNFLVPALRYLSITNLDERTPEDFRFAEESQIYGDTMNSFIALLASFPFEQLEGFTLRRAQFGSPAPFIVTEEMAYSGSVSLSSLPVPFQLLQRLKNAHKVRLDNPDRFLLMGMLYPQLDTITKDRMEGSNNLDVPIVLSSVKELFFAVNTDDQAHRSIMRYLSDRRERYLVRGEDGAEIFVGKKIDVLKLTFSLVSKEMEATIDWKSLVVAKKTCLNLAGERNVALLE